jgi:hypothetical protein
VRLRRIENLGPTTEQHSCHRLTPQNDAHRAFTTWPLAPRHLPHHATSAAAVSPPFDERGGRRELCDRARALFRCAPRVGTAIPPVPSVVENSPVTAEKSSPLARLQRGRSRELAIPLHDFTARVRLNGPAVCDDARFV